VPPPVPLQRRSRLALWFGLVPLAAGVLALLLFWWSRHSVFVTLGLCVLALAPFAWLAGLVLVLGRGPWTGRRWLALAVLLIDLPAAAVCASLGLDFMAQVTVVVRNRSAQPLEQVHLDVTGLQRLELGGLAPGASRTASFVPVCDGRALVRFVAAGRMHEGEAVGYVTNGPFGERVTVEVTPDLTVRRTEAPR
jgi:hypothetical protein